MASIIRFQHRRHFDCNDIGRYHQYGGGIVSAYSGTYPNDRDFEGIRGRQLEYSKNISLQCLLFDSSWVILGKSHRDSDIVTATAVWHNKAQSRELLCRSGACIS